MYFIEHLCDIAQRENHPEFVRMVERDILRVVDAVAPADGSGANVKVVRNVRSGPNLTELQKADSDQVLHGLQQKAVLLPQTVQELEEVLKERETAAAHPSLTDDPMEDVKEGRDHGRRSNGSIRLDKRQIEQRIEEDRERHKRLRESIWAINPDDDNEFEKLWDETSEVGDDDYLAAEEDAQERRLATTYE